MDSAASWHVFERRRSKTITNGKRGRSAPGGSYLQGSMSWLVPNPVPDTAGQTQPGAVAWHGLMKDEPWRALRLAGTFIKSAKTW